MAEYVSLHNHTQYSLLDGAITVTALAKRAKELRMAAVGITDHGNMFGALELFKSTKKEGVKAIIGCEVYVTGDRTSRGQVAAEAGMNHLILLAKDDVGYKNLCKIVTSGYTEGFYMKPRTDRQVLEAHHSGIVCLSACFKGEVPQLLTAGREADALNAAMYYQDLFGKANYYLELQDNGIKGQWDLNDKLIALSKKTGIPIVATNDCHYMYSDDSFAHDVLLCIQTGKTVKDEGRMKFETKGLYFKSPEEMAFAFAQTPEALKNTLVIAEMCNFEFKLGSFKLPGFPLPEGVTAEQRLAELATQGLRVRFKGAEPPAEYATRLDSELKMITKMGFPGYLLIVHDFINFAKSEKIPVGPGRGSAAGSLVSYATGITDIDPIRYGLLFERFLNPDRISMPDIDVDFCRDGRQRVINYVREKYGADHVSQIITFGTMAARSAVRDVGRALGVPLMEVDRLAKLIPLELKMTLEKALESEQQLAVKYNSDPKVKELFDVAKRLEGLSRHASTHAAGVLIAPEPITNFMPLYLDDKDKKDGSSLVAQFDMKAIEEIGLLKFDFLGLKTLTIIDLTVEFLKKRDIDLVLADIPMDDEATFALLKSANTTSIFQLESDGMRDILRQMGPDRFEDLIALVALYRPGPIGSGMVGDFIKRKKGIEPIVYQWPELADTLDEILRETYGVVLYQEQVMRIANKVAGFSLAQADMLRRAMGKKKPEEMAKQKAGFIEGSAANGYSKEAAEQLFDLMASFAEYGFNKSHSAAYAYLAYQTAYLKAHYPAEFMAANLSAEMNVQDKLIPLINECRETGVTLLPPDINLSGEAFTIENGNSIRFGLGAIKKVGNAALYGLMLERDAGEFSSFKEFLARVNKSKLKVNSGCVENMVYAGVFDSFSDKAPHVARSMFLLEQVAFAKQLKEPKKAKKSSPGLFEEAPAPVEAVAVPAVDPWSDDTLLGNEYVALGFYLSGHPIISRRTKLNANGVKAISGLLSREEELGIEMSQENFRVAGVVSDIEVKKKADKKFAIIQLGDETGICEMLVSGKLYAKCELTLKKGVLLVADGFSVGDGKGIKRVANQFFNAA